jgi:amino acid adenylation domain-containing protein
MLGMEKAASLLEVFLNSVVSRPEAIAVTSEGTSLTYSELNRQANALAERLAYCGVRLNDRVGLCMQRSQRLIVAILGILKSGAAYVPLDPENPKARLLYIVEDAGLSHVVADEEGRAILQGLDLGVIDINDVKSEKRQENSNAGKSGVSDSHDERVAYIIYTSGTTGKPKGVVVTHKNVVSLLESTSELFDFGPDDVWTLFHSFAFDFSVWEMWGALAYGGRLVIPTFWVTRSPADFIDLLLSERVTVLNQTPSAFKQLIPLAVAKRRQLRSHLRTVIFGGEAIAGSDIRLWLEKFGDHPIKLINMFGTTETTVHATYHRVLAAHADSTDCIIGKGLPKWDVCVLDADLNPVDPGIEGEIYIGGEGVTRGYLGNLDLTNQRFISAKDRIGDCKMLYKTGDLGRCDEDGVIVHLGRSDDQVKINGFRIELGEVTSALLSALPVDDAITLAVNDKFGGKRLVGVAVWKKDHAFSEVGARESLSRLIPAYMLPSRIVLTDSIPLTPNGKADLQHLKNRADTYFANEGQEDTADTSERQAVAFVVELCKELLEADAIDTSVSFFSLGGHSLLATRLVARLREKFTREISISDVFEKSIEDIGGLLSDYSLDQHGMDSNETQILAMCEELLEVRGLDTSKSFFELGGHSLLAGRFVAWVQEEFGEKLDIRSLFDHPLAAVIASVTGDAGERIAQGADIRLEGRADGEMAIASPSQNRLWFLNKLDGPSPTYNVPISLRIHGELNAEALIRSLNTIVSRHQALRTAFVETEMSVVQKILPNAELKVNRIRIGEKVQGKLGDELNAIADLEARLPFDLERGPLVRITLMDAGNQVNVLLVTFHHSAVDGASLKIFFAELTALYHDLSRGVANHLAECDVHYADFAVWLNRRIDSGVLNYQLEYWKEKLRGLPPLLALPIDKPRPAVQSFQGASVLFNLSPRLLKDLKDLSARHGATLFMTLLAAFKVLLYRHTGQADIAVGVPVANRALPSLETLIGFFANTVVVRSQLDGTAQFADFLQDTKASVLEALHNQEIPFERVVEAVAPERNNSYMPLFQVLFVLQEWSTTQFKLDGVHCVPLRAAQQDFGVAKFDLMLDLEEIGDSMKCEMVYGTALFEPGTVKRLCDNYVVLLESIAGRPGGLLGTLDILPRDQRQKILSEWNPVEETAMDRRCVHYLFEGQVQRSPEASAIVFDGRMLSYLELNAKANQIAHFLIEKGIRPEDKVGVYLSRGLDLPVAVLGVLKSGAAYVGVDPHYAEERIDGMIQSVDAAMFLTTTDLAPSLRGLSCEAICLDSPNVHISRQPVTNPVVDVGPDNLMQILYTSGSTGRPKGIEIPHGGWNNVINWHHKTVSKDRNFLQFFSVSTDSFFTEMFSTICCGTTVFMIPEEIRFNSDELLRFIHDNKIEKVNLPVVVLQQWASDATGDIALFEGIRDICTTGEQLQITDAVRSLFERLPNCRLHNHYGPTETHASTYHTFSGDRTVWKFHAPIGRPFANCTNYILNDQLEPVPAGAVGELYIGGVQLARGYMRNPASTAERFVPDPFSSIPGRRMYRTGDLARYLEGGTIEYLGRIDNVVKVRGYRVEIEEVEALLNSYEPVEVAVVALEGDVANEKYLSCYFIAKPAKKVNIDEFAAYARERLSTFQLPAKFQEVDKFPLSPNKKVDRKTLVSQFGSPMAAAVREKKEASSTEEIACSRLWSEILGNDDVGIDENFFALGGHSLLAARLAQRISDTFDVEVSIREIFANPTIEALLSSLERRSGKCL